MTAPGWYNDPVDPDVQRYWDGEGWLGDPIPASEPAPSGPPEGAEPPSWARPSKPAPPSAGSPSAESPSADEPAAEPPSAWTPPSIGAQPSIGEPPSIGASPSAGAPPPVSLAPGTPLPQGAVVLPPGTPVPPGGFQPGQLPPGAIILPPGTPLPPGLLPQGTLPSGAVQVLLPPQAKVPGQGTVTPHGRAIAPLGARLLARLIDIVLVALLNVIVTGWFVYQYIHDMGPIWREVVRRFFANEPLTDLAAPERSSWLQVVILILIAAAWFAYEVPATANSGQTVGKRLLKIKVMRLESEEPIGFGRAIRRWNPLGLSVLLWTCGIGFLLQFLDSLSPMIDWPLRRAYHDRSAATVVVMAEPPASTPPTETENAGEPQ